MMFGLKMYIRLRFLCFGWVFLMYCFGVGLRIFGEEIGRFISSFLRVG